MRSQFAFISAVAGLLLLSAESRGQNVPAPAPEQASATAPDDWANMPSGQAVVKYLNGKLTVRANNARLSEVLREVCTQVGAALDFPSGADAPIFGVVGPGPAREVIATLLDGAQFTYAMARSAADPNALASVLVFPKSTDSKTLGPVSQDMVGQEQVNSKTVDSTPSGAETKKMMGELLTQAKAELANSGGIVFDNHGGENAGDAESASTAPQPDAATFLKLVEAQIGAIGDAAATDANSPQQLAPATSQNPVSTPRRRRH
jgi:hypothetical protein